MLHQDLKHPQEDKVFLQYLKRQAKDNIQYLRHVDKFAGDSIVIGCGNKLDFSERMDELLSRSHHKLHSDQNHFFSIDILEERKSDATFNIKSQNFPSELNQRFNFVFLENLPYATYLKDAHFDNNNIKKILDKKGGVILIMGGVPNVRKQIEGQLYGENKNNKALFIVGQEGVDPGLIVRSLNADAQSLIKATGFNIDDIRAEEEYDDKANEAFLKEKSLQLINRQIQRLKQESEIVVKGIFGNESKIPLKKRKIVGLSALKSGIETHYPETPLNEILQHIEETHSDLGSGTHRHLVRDMLKTLLDLEEYHFKHMSAELEARPTSKSKRL